MHKNTFLLSPFLSPLYIWYVYFYLKTKNKPSSLIYLIYYCNSEKANFKLSTSESICPEDWDYSARMPIVKRGRDDLRAIRIVLDRFATTLDNRLNDLKVQGIEPSRANLKEAFNKTDRTKLAHHYFEEFIEQNKTFNSIGWKKKYNNILRKFKLFAPGVTLAEIDDPFLQRFSDWFIVNYDYTDNTLSRHLIFFKTFINWAKKNGYYFGSLTYSVPKYQSDDIALSESEIKLLEDYECKGYSLKTKDIALIGIYSGQRFSDYSIFDKADVNGDMIIKRAQKTGNDSFIPLHPKLRGILDKYDWNIPKISNQKFNKYFKVICRDAGIDREFKKVVKRGGTKKTYYFKAWQVVSSHTCRRTYITLASSKGVPDEIIMKVTGIKDVKTLYKYKKITLKGVMDATKDLF